MAPPAAFQGGDEVPSKHIRTPMRREHIDEVKELDILFQSICPMIQKYEMENTMPDETKVVEYRSPAELRAAIDLSVPDGEGSIEDFLAACKDTLTYSVRTSHPRFMNQLYAGSNPVGQVTELLTGVLNSTVHTYAAGPVFSVVERYMINKVAELLGHENPSSCDGVFAPGGSHANLSALMAARAHMFPHVSAEGWRPEDRPVVFASAHAHYSIRQAVSIMGIGASSIVQVEVDSDGRMIPSALETALKKEATAGRRPLAVVAVAGTTVLGAYDPINELVPICRRARVWLHVDGAWGGGVLFSPALRGMIRGVAAADSFCFNPHKLLGAPIQCSMLLIHGRPDALSAATGFAQHAVAAPAAASGGCCGPVPPRVVIPTGGCVLVDGDGSVGAGFTLDGGGSPAPLRASSGGAGDSGNAAVSPLPSQVASGGGATWGGGDEEGDGGTAEYLFHEEAEAGEEADLDLGRRSLQCGRKPDALKLWLCWKRYGAAGLGRRVERARALALHLADCVAADRRFALAAGRPPGFCVCFYYIPPSLRAEAAAGMGSCGGGLLVPAVRERLGAVTARLYARLRRSGRAMINFSPLPDMGLPNFFRAVVIQPQLLAEDLNFILEEIDRLGQDL